MKQCVLDEKKFCNSCGECNMCDLDKTKVCDNCCKCIERPGADYNELNIAEYLKNADNQNETELLDDNLSADDYAEAYEDEYDEFDESYSEPVEALNIDPNLLAEWEEKLRSLEYAERSLDVKTLRLYSARKH